MSENNSEFEKGIETREVTSGYQGIVKHGDGRATKFWAPTEDEARAKAIDHLRDEA